MKEINKVLFSTLSCTLHFNKWKWMFPYNIISINSSFSPLFWIQSNFTGDNKTCNFTPFRMRDIPFSVQLNESFSTVGLDA